MIKWTRKMKLTALAGAVLAAIPAFAAVHLTKAEISPFWSYALPLLLCGFVYGMLGLILHSVGARKMLKNLPEIDYPFQSMLIQLIIYCFLFIFFTLGYFIVLLAPNTLFYHGLLSLPSMILMTAALLAVTLSGGQLIYSKKAEGIIYRDAASPSKLSRQDLLFSLHGSWRDGLVFGFKTFTLDSIDSWEAEAHHLEISGRENGKKYILVLYTPKAIKMCERILKEKCPEKICGMTK